MSEETKNEMIMRLALYKHAKYGWLTPFESTDGEEYSPDDYARVSEWLTVEFKPLTASEITGAQLTALTRLRAATVNEFSEKLGEIDARIANVRALTGPKP